MTLPRARLYSRPGCHLCEAAVEHLRQLSARMPHRLELVDISADPELERTYGLRIPVLALGGREIDAPLSPALLERALRQAQGNPAASSAQAEQSSTSTRPEVETSR